MCPVSTCKGEPFLKLCTSYPEMDMLFISCIKKFMNKYLTYNFKKGVLFTYFGFDQKDHNKFE